MEKLYHRRVIIVGMKYLAVLGRQPEVSAAELSALYEDVELLSGKVAVFDSEQEPDIARLGGVLKIAEKMEAKPLVYLSGLSGGKITLGISDYSKSASRKSAMIEALKLKKILIRHGQSVRVVENKEATLSTATSLHNGLSGKNERKIEFIKVDDAWYKVIGVQDIGAYAKRDQARPARDAKVGMLPPKLAQILINLCGNLKPGAVVLDPFCGTGVVLQEALLMGYRAYGTDISERMIKYSEKNLNYFGFDGYNVEVGDATSFKWSQPIDAVACEGYLGKPMSQIPSGVSLKEEKQECGTIVLNFLRNLVEQIVPGTPVVIAVPAWLREDGEYSRLEVVDKIDELGYNVDNKTREGLLYYREGQIVARDIIILRKK